MGVYIPNIEMPKSCDDCPHPTCTLWQSVNGGERNEKCPISPVPPHGRCIDADAFISTIRPLCEEDKFKACTFETVKRLMVEHISSAPTIIEAEVRTDNEEEQQKSN